MPTTSNNISETSDAHDLPASHTNAPVTESTKAFSSAEEQRPTQELEQAEGAAPIKTLESVKLLKDWSSWLVGIQTAAIAAIGALIKDGDLNLSIRLSAVGAVICFVISIGFASMLLVSLPAFHMRNSEVNKGSDFIELAAFVGKATRFRNPKLLSLVNGQQWFFFAGIFCFALFVFLRLLNTN
jgi:hypothetical protein